MTKFNLKTFDLETILYLYITHVVIEKEKKYTTQKVKENVAYIFDSYDEFKEYFKEYVEDVSEEVIDLAIYTKSKKGGIVALKGLCDHIIMKLQIKNDNLYLTQEKDYNLYLTQEQIDEIHSRGKITALEKVKEWESFDICAPGDAIGSAKDRCYHFKNNCHECLLNYASRQSEYDKVAFKVVQPFNNKKSHVLEKTRK